MMSYGSYPVFYQDIFYIVPLGKKNLMSYVKYTYLVSKVSPHRGLKANGR